MNAVQLFVGLGNPGSEYEATRHNAGFWWVETWARRLGVTLAPERTAFGLLARVRLAGQMRYLLMPQTFMNLSGKSVAAVAGFYKIPTDAIMVVHDELDLLPGAMRYKCGGGNGGHNGLKDIQAQLGSAAFWRLRLGIGHPGHRDAVVGHVLRKPPPDEREAIEGCIHRSLDAVDELLAGQHEAFARRLGAKPAGRVE